MPAPVQAAGLGVLPAPSVWAVGSTKPAARWSGPAPLPPWLIMRRTMRLL